MSLLKHFSVKRGAPRRALCERPTSDFLATVWAKWRRRDGQPCFVDFSRAAIERLDAESPHWRDFVRLIDRQVVSCADTRSARLSKLYNLFMQGKHPLDLPAEPETDDPLMAIAAE
jgi:hypothetical protein